MKENECLGPHHCMTQVPLSHDTAQMDQFIM